jgi:WAS/WASL-interacting protein
MQTAARRPGKRRRRRREGAGRAETKPSSSPPARVNKQKPPPTPVPGRGARRTGGPRAEVAGTRRPGPGARPGRGLAQAAPPLAAPTDGGPGSSEHEVSCGRGLGGRTHPLSGIVLLHHSRRARARARGAGPTGRPAWGPRPLRRGGAFPAGGWRRCRAPPRSSLAPARPPSRARTLPLFVAPVTLKAGLPHTRSRTHTHARSPPLGAPPCRRPRGPGPRARPRRPPARPGAAAPPSRRAVGGPARAPQLHPRAR